MAKATKRLPDDPVDGEETKPEGMSLPPIESMVKKLSERFSEELRNDD